MKKQLLKNLRLNKNSVSNLQMANLKGGASDSNQAVQTLDLNVCDTDLNSCYWLVCPFSGVDTICIAAN
ncbi:MAG: hypothetical protein AAF617_03515 [Bacteroidota bacterium]